MFNASKRETHYPGKNFKQLSRRLKSTFNVEENKDPFDSVLAEKKKEGGKDCYVLREDRPQIAIFGGSREKFTSAEIGVLRQFIDKGGSVMIMLGEGGEAKYGTNINFLLEEYGIMINPDAVCRTSYYKYLHPKEVLISSGVLNRSIPQAMARFAGKDKAPAADDILGGSGKAAAGGVAQGGGATFVYPYGATLNVQRPAMALLSSGHESYPLNRPVAALWDGSKDGHGRLLVLGSVRMADDDWLAKEENGKLVEVLVQCLNPAEPLKVYEKEDDSEIAEYHHVPDTGALASRVRCCLQEAEEVPRDFRAMFDDGLFRLDTDNIPDTVRLYSSLDVKHDVLTLIPPQFEAPLPPLQPAVFPPTLREPPAPALDLFDLDEQFASERVRLAKLTNKCKDEDLDFYVRQSAEVLGIPDKLPEGRRTAKHCLELMLRELVNWKRVMPSDPAPRTAPPIGQHL